MANLRTIHWDTQGLRVNTGGYTFRPIPAAGFAHAYNMTDGGLKMGDKVKAYHVSGTPLAKITTPDGTILHWHSDGKSYCL